MHRPQNRWKFPARETLRTPARRRFRARGSGQSTPAAFERRPNAQNLNCGNPIPTPISSQHARPPHVPRRAARVVPGSNDEGAIQTGDQSGSTPSETSDANDAGADVMRVPTRTARKGQTPERSPAARPAVHRARALAASARRARTRTRLASRWPRRSAPWRGPFPPPFLRSLQDIIEPRPSRESAGSASGAPRYPEPAWARGLDTTTRRSAAWRRARCVPDAFFAEFGTVVGASVGVGSESVRRRGRA